MSSSSSTSVSTVTSCKESSPVNLLYLPDDILLSCLARVSRLYYPTLSFVSKRLRSLVASIELYETRKLLGCTESCLYVSIYAPSEFKPHWFTLCRTPTQIPNPNLKGRWYTQCFRPCFRQKGTLKNNTKKKEKKTTGNRLITVPTRNFSLPFGWTQTTIGSSIYLIGTKSVNDASSMVLFMDCRSHTWQEAPSMQVGREYPEVSILDGKIYVTGGTGNMDSSNLIECFDPKTQKWEDVPIHGVEIGKSFISQSLAIDGNLYLFGKEDKKVVYKPKENRWDAVASELFLGWDHWCSCVIDNVLYCYSFSGWLEWYDSEERSWRVLKGVEEFLPKYNFDVQMVDYNGKIAVLWKENACGIYSIWCAEIALKRYNKHEIYGKIEWCDVVLKISALSFLELASVTL